jgi:hypothetical protein
MLTSTVATIVALALAIAGAGKVRDPAAFGEVVRAYRVLPDGVAGALGRVLPAAQLVVAALLLVGLAAEPLLRIAAGCAVLLFGAFFLGLTVNLLRGRRWIDCGCFAFGSSAGEKHGISWFHSLRALGFALAASATGILGAPTSLLDAVVGLAVGTILVLSAVAFVQVSAVVSPPSPRVDTYLRSAKRYLDTH